MKKTKKTNPHRRTSLNEFLKQEGLYEQVVAQAEKEILAWKVQSAVKEGMDDFAAGRVLKEEQFAEQMRQYFARREPRIIF